MKTLRDSQQTAYTTLRKAQYGILNAPTGWGKSLTLCALTGHNRKVLVAIPQRVIAKGFVKEEKIKLPNGKTLDYAVTHNLCENVGGAKLKMLKDWLCSDEDGIIVTTHQALSRLWGQLSDAEKTAATTDITFVIDEAHHIHSAEESFNHMGALVRYVLEQSDARLLLATAYFFRGDELPILPEDHLNQFARFYVPFDEFWASLKHLKQYRYDFAAYKGTPWPVISTLLQKSNEPTLFFVPWEGHRLFLGKGKQAFVDRLIKTIETETGATLWKGGNPKGKVIVSLIENDYRAEKLRFVFDHGDQIQAIITVGMFREGADWVQCSRVIDIIPTSSNQDRMQRFGRLIRDWPGKTCASYYSLFPHISDHPKEKQREELTRLYAHFHASLVLENALAPIKIAVPPSRHSGVWDEGLRPFNFLGEYDENTQEGILADAHERLIKLAEDGPIQPATAQHAIESVLVGYGIKKNKNEMARQIVLLLRRKANPHLAVADLVKAGFDKVWASDALLPIKSFSAGIGGPDTLAEIRRVIMSVFDARWLESYEAVKQLPEAPAPSNARSYWWMNNNRAFHDRGQLSAERIKLLEEIPWWRWVVKFSDVWQTHFDQLAQLAAPPKNGTPLAQWIARQIARRKKLTLKQVRLLESLAWWKWDRGGDERWQTQFDAYRAHKGKPPVASELWNWQRVQRRNFHSGTLSKDRIKKLNSLTGWTWGNTRKA
jgi:hypothetical protein